MTDDAEAEIVSTTADRHGRLPTRRRNSDRAFPR